MPATIHKAHLGAKSGEQFLLRRMEREDEDMKVFGTKDRKRERHHATHNTSRRVKQRVFIQARAKKPNSPPAPSVSAEPHTTSELAGKRNDGMDCRPCIPETKPFVSKTVGAMSYARIGNDPPDAAAVAIVTNAPVVEVETTEHKTAHLRSLEIITPLRHEGWSRLLNKHNLSVKYPNIPEYIRHGANAGIPEITCTYIPPNNISILTHSSAFEEIINREFDRGRYAGPFTRKEVEDRIGPFQTSPLSLVPKAGKPNKFRLIQNLSFPRNNPSVRSINYALDSDAFPCTWGTFSTICTLINNLPPGSQGACRDIAEAYRIIPLAPDQWPGMVVRLSKPDEYGINKCNSFGSATAGGLFGLFADALADIFRAEGIGPTCKWVDDQTFIRILRIYLEEYNRTRANLRRSIMEAGGWKQQGGRLWTGRGPMPDGRVEEFDEDMSFPIRDLATDRNHGYTYDLSDVDHISDQLGIPWEHSKDIGFSSSFPFIGFTWDIEKKSVALRTEKREKYLLAIKEWRETRTHTLEEVQKLYGKLSHATLAHPDGRPYLANLETMLGVFHDSPHRPRTPPRQLPADLDWWTSELSKPSIGSAIPTAHEVHDIAAFSDASSSTGIAIVIGARWRAWKLLPGWNADKRDIGWAEAVGFEFLVGTIAHIHPNNRETHFEVYGDNQGVVEGWKRGRSRNPRVNEVFKRITKLSRDTGIVVHTKYVRSAKNPADDPSRGIYPPTSYLLPPIDIPQELRTFVVNYDCTTIGDERTNETSPPTVQTLPQPKPATGGQLERNREDDNLSTIARYLYEAKTTFQWN